MEQASKSFSQAQRLRKEAVPDYGSRRENAFEEDHPVRFDRFRHPGQVVNGRLDSTRMRVYVGLRWSHPVTGRRPT